MHKKFFSTLLTVALVGGLLSIAAPALAGRDFDNVYSFLPDEDDGWNGDSTVLSDKSDGTDALAHLTAITQSGITNARWYQCPQNIETSKPAGTNPGNDDTKVDTNELPSCDVFIGQDTTPRQPISGGGGVFSATPDLAFDTFWNIPADHLAGNEVDILVLGCVGDPTASPNLTGGSKNCLQTQEEQIETDDASTGSATDQTSAGEMFAFCTADTALTLGPDTTGVETNEPCQYDTDMDNNITDAGDADTATEQAAVDARFKPWTHGDPIPNEGAVIRATTGTEMTDLWIQRDYTGVSAASTNTQTGDETRQCTLIKTTSSAKTWECGLRGGPNWVAAADDNVAQAVDIYTNTGVGAAGCCPDLDVHYTASSPRTTAAVVGTFAPGNTQAPVSTTPANDTTCANPDREETNALGDDEYLFVCFTDQFGDVFNPANATLESAGPGEFTTCGGQLHDHNGDGLDEHCHVTAGDFTNGKSTTKAINNVAVAGDQTLTVCAESEPGPATASGNPAPTGHGCANENPKDTLVKHWIAIPQHVHLVYQGTGDAADPCHTGDTTKENQVGDQDTLLVCTFSDTPAHQPATTAQAGGGRLQWSIAPVSGGEVTATRFVGSPPSETGADGTATVTIEAFRSGNDIISVGLVDDNGDGVDTDAVQKRVTGTSTSTQCDDQLDNDGDGKTDFPQDPGCSDTADNDETDTGTGGGDTSSKTTLTIRYEGDVKGGTFKGSVANNKNKCVKGRTVNLFKVKSGADPKVGSDKSNASGNWSIREPNAKGKFYAKATKKTFVKGNGATHTCQKDKSVTIKVQQ